MNCACSRRLNELKVISPVLHHLAARWQIFRTVVRGAYLVSLDVCQLPLNDVGSKASFVQDRRCHCAKAVRRRAREVTHPLERKGQCVFAGLGEADLEIGERHGIPRFWDQTDVRYPLSESLGNDRH
jgi:hypothetical protein